VTLSAGTRFGVYEVLALIEARRSPLGSRTARIEIGEALAIAMAIAGAYCHATQISQRGNSWSASSKTNRARGARRHPLAVADRAKNRDWQARRVVFEATATTDTLTDVRERLQVLLPL
jgi:hypothetical protein